MKKVFNWTNVFGTGFVFLVLWILSVTAVSLDFLNVFEQVIGQFDINDVVFSRRKDQMKVDSSVVLVNIGNLSRGELAVQLENIAAANPKVIGFDTFFRNEKDSVDDAPLEAAFSRHGDKVILGTKVSDETLLFDSANAGLLHRILPSVFELDSLIIWNELETSHPKFNRHTSSGFVNVYTEGDAQFETWRYEPIKELLKNGDYEYCLGAELVKRYDSAAFVRLESRGNERELINYRGNTDKFVFINTQDALDGNFKPEWVKDKIVIFGYLGEDGFCYKWDEDTYYSPMNSRPVGRTTPDMYGAVGHANFVSMLLNDDYINELDNTSDTFLAIIFCFFNTAFFIFLLNDPRWDNWYDGISKILQIIELSVLSYLVIFLLEKYNLKMDLSLVALTILLSGDVIELFVGFIMEQFYHFQRISRKRRARQVDEN